MEWLNEISKFLTGMCLFGLCADNVTITSGSGVTIATDDDSTAQHQYVKIEFGGDGTFTKVTNAVPLPISGTSIAITSLPTLGIGSAVTISNLAATPLTVSGTTIAITSLPTLGIGSAVTISNLAATPLTVSGTTIAITSLPTLGIGSAVTISNLAATPLTISGTTIAITSLPPLGAGSVTISNLAGTPITVSGTTIAITSLPPLGAATVSISAGTQITVLDTFPVYRMLVTTTSPISGSWAVTRTYTAAVTNSILLPLSASTTAHHITDIVFSNAQTHGNFTISVSPSDASVYHLIDRIYFRDYGGAVMNLRHPLVCNTNSAILLTSRSSTDHSIFISGYTI